MTSDERQALREKHGKRLSDGGRCLACGGAMAHPCDVIKVLDAYEALIEYHDHDGNTDREDPWCHTCYTPYPCEKGKALGHPDGADV